MPLYNGEPSDRLDTSNCGGIVSNSLKSRRSPVENIPTGHDSQVNEDRLNADPGKHDTAEMRDNFCTIGVFPYQINFIGCFIYLVVFVFVSCYCRKHQFIRISIV